MQNNKNLILILLFVLTTSLTQLVARRRQRHQSKPTNTKINNKHAQRPRRQEQQPEKIKPKKIQPTILKNNPRMLYDIITMNQHYARGLIEKAATGLSNALNPTRTEWKTVLKALKINSTVISNKLTALYKLTTNIAQIFRDEQLLNLYTNYSLHGGNVPAEFEAVSVDKNLQLLYDLVKTKKLVKNLYFNPEVNYEEILILLSR